MIGRMFQRYGILRTLALFGLAWNCVFGGLDYLLIALENQAYINFKAWFFNVPSPEALLMYYNAWPTYARIGWIVNLWGGIAGSILLLFRDRHASWLFAGCAVGVVMVFHLQYYAPTPRVAGDPWAEWANLARIGLACISFAHSIAVIVLLRTLAAGPPQGTH